MQSNQHGPAERALSSLKREYTFIGKRHIKAWQAWLAVGVLAGIVGATFFIANRSGEFSPSEAAYEGEGYDFPWRRGPRITVVSPNGGEVWPVGTTQNISWCGEGKFPQGATRVFLYRGQEAAQIFNPSGSGTALCPSRQGFDWTSIPGKTEPGSNYRIKIEYVSEATGKVVARDWSDKPFSIVASSSPTLR